MRKRVFDMEIHVMIVLPDGFLEKLGIDDEFLAWVLSLATKIEY